MTAVTIRATVEDIVRIRNEALELYDKAYEAIKAADAAVKLANERAALASPGINGYTYSHVKEIDAFRNAVTLSDPDKYRRTARRLLDVNIWAYIIERTDLERLMDREAKDQLRDQMRYVPEVTNRDGEIINQGEIDKLLPPVTVENVTATIETFMAEADTIFRRGIANAFAKLDRRFRSHDGWKIGSRVILDRAFNEHGNWSHYSNHRDTLIDIERTLTILDQQDEEDERELKPSYATTIGAINQARRGIWNPTQSMIETDYFRIRIFKNGNAHLWFLRDDLVEKVNKLLAEFYGEVLADDATERADDPLKDIKTTPARRYGFFPTPDDAAEIVFRKAPLKRRFDQSDLTVLEPSAGKGNLARRAAQERKGLDTVTEDGEGGRRKITYQDFIMRARVDCVELQPQLCEQLEAEGIYRRVMNADFLHLTPATTGLYDRVIMNPPFDLERDIDHVVHALNFLKEDGYLIAIMSAGTEFRQTRKAKAFRDLMNRYNARWTDLPAGSFSSVGTYVNTLMVELWKNGRRPSY